MVIIEDKYMNQIKSVLAYPDIEELLLTDDQIKDICIAPSLTDYFVKFPIKVDYQEAMGTNQERILPFPDDYTFGIVDCRIVDVGGTTFGTGTSFWDVVIYNAIGGNVTSSNNSGSYGQPKYNPSALIETREMYRNKFKSYQNQYTTIKFHPDYENRELKIYTSVGGMLNVTWAKYSENFNSVKLQFKNDVVDLSKARLLNHLADTAGILTDTNLEITINIDALKTRASDLETKVKERWAEMHDIIYIHAV